MSHVTPTLPEPIQEIVAGFHETHFGVNTVTVTLADGAIYGGVQVARGGEVIRVAGYPDVPFDASMVTLVTDESV